MRNSTDMEKKNQYIAPEVIMLTPIHESLMYVVSVPGGNPDEGEPEAKQGVFEEDAETSYSQPNVDYDIWAEETEYEGFFHEK